MLRIISKILISAGIKLLTEKFLITALILIAEDLAKRTTNTLDDELVKEIKIALKDESNQPRG